MKYLDAPGAPADFKDLRGAWAKDLWTFLTSGLNPHAKPVETRRDRGQETVVFEVDVEVSQIRAHDIRPTERVSVTFNSEGWQPEVLALRRDFPYVPHVNPREQEFPRSLCLYDQNFDEISLRWTPASFVERVRWWLAETSKGTLHGNDQPLEPILVDRFPPLILPADFLQQVRAGGAPQSLYVIARNDLKVFRASREPQGQGISFIAASVECKPHVHGVIRTRPKSLATVHDLLKDVGFDLVQELRTHIGGWDQKDIPPNAHLILITVLPKQRKVAGPVEAWEMWAFLLGKPMSDVGQALGLWEMRDGAPGRIIGGDADRSLLEGIGVDVLNPTFELSRSGAALLNGVEPSELKLTAIGMGALGSQVADNLVRAGFGVWTGIDPDFLLPHNVARHEMTSQEAGASKVDGMQARLNSIFYEQAMPMTIEADLLHPGDKEQAIRRALEEGDVIVDMSANQAVARHLAHLDIETRRCSVFLNPSGSDLVLLCEDKRRKVRLDWLEYQYYRVLIREPALIDHLRAQEGQVRYARSCRDLTSRVSQHHVAMHSGIAAAALQEVLRSDGAFVGIWTSDKKLNVCCFEVDVLAAQEFSANGWRILTDGYFLKKVALLRQAKCKKETGGVLIGSFDHKNRIIYLVDTIESPPDSEEWPTLYIRGCEGLKAATEEIVRRTDGQLQYIGEWHSHPDGYASDPSTDDRKVFSWLSEHLARDGNPPVMLIAGQRDFRIFAQTMKGAVAAGNPIISTEKSARSKSSLNRAGRREVPK